MKPRFKRLRVGPNEKNKIPFMNGNVVLSTSYCRYTDNDVIEWKTSQETEFAEDMKLTGVRSTGTSACTIDLVDSKGVTYQIFTDDFVAANEYCQDGWISGTWRFLRKSQTTKLTFIQPIA